MADSREHLSRIFQRRSRDLLAADLYTICIISANIINELKNMGIKLLSLVIAAPKPRRYGDDPALLTAL